MHSKAFTALLAWFVFHENVDRRIALGMLAIRRGERGSSAGKGTRAGAGVLGTAAIAGACCVRS